MTKAIKSLLWAFGVAIIIAGLSGAFLWTAIKAGGLFGFPGITAVVIGWATIALFIVKVSEK